LGRRNPRKAGWQVAHIRILMMEQKQYGGLGGDFRIGAPTRRESRKKGECGNLVGSPDKRGSKGQSFLIASVGGVEKKRALPVRGICRAAQYLTRQSQDWGMDGRWDRVLDWKEYKTNASPKFRASSDERVRGGFLDDQAVKSSVQFWRTAAHLGG